MSNKQDDGGMEDIGGEDDDVYYYYDSGWDALQVQWKTPQRIFTLNPSLSKPSSSSSKNVSVSQTSDVVTNDSSVSVATVSTSSSSTVAAGNGIVNLNNHHHRLHPKRSDINLNNTNNAATTNLPEVASPARSCLCAPIIIQNQFILMATNDDNLVLFGHFNMDSRQQHKSINSIPDVTSTSNVTTNPTGETDSNFNGRDSIDYDDDNNDYSDCTTASRHNLLPLPEFTTPPLAQCSLSSLVSSSTATTGDGDRQHRKFDWTIIQMLWLDDLAGTLVDDDGTNHQVNRTAGTLYVLTDDSYVFQLEVELPPPKAQQSSQQSTQQARPSFKLKQHWVSDELGVNCMAVQCSEMGKDTDFVYLGFNTGRIQAWKVPRQLENLTSIKETTNSPLLSSPSLHKKTPMITRRPSGGSPSSPGIIKSFVGPSASSLSFSRRPSFNQLQEEKRTPSLVWSGSFPLTAIQSMAVVSKHKTQPSSDGCSVSDPEPHKTLPSKEDDEDGGRSEVTKKSFDEILDREDSLSSLHSSSEVSGSPRFFKKRVDPSGPLPPPPPSRSPLTTQASGPQSENYVLVVVTITQNNTIGRSMNEDEVQQNTSSMVQMIDLKRISVDTRLGIVSEDSNEISESTRKATSKPLFPLMNYTVPRSSPIDIVDTATILHSGEKNGVLLPQPSRPASAHGANLAFPLLHPFIGSFDGSNSQDGERSSDQLHHYSNACVMLPDGTVATFSPPSLQQKREQFLLAFPAIGSGLVKTLMSDAQSSPQNQCSEQRVISCLRGGTCYALPISVNDGDELNDSPGPATARGRERKVVHAYGFPHDLDKDHSSVYVQSFTAGNLVVNSSGLEVPVMVFVWPGGTIDVYSCHLIPSESSSIEASTVIHDLDDFVSRADRMALEDMIEDGTVKSLIKIIREINDKTIESMQTQKEDQNWNGLLSMISSREFQFPDEAEEVTLDELCFLPALRPTRKFLLSLALQ